MSRPNIDNKFDDTDVVLFECECKNGHYLEVLHDRDEKYLEDELFFTFKDYPNSLWQVLKWWWKQRGVWHSELMLSYNDVIYLRDVLNKYIKFIENRKKNEKQKD